ncbi:uncharacterized protein [Montipora capricornis]|uniref:uncharacterized protein n=1 Tax=Montipora capricornis TaxID=246305 RepID=UPI0035F119E6
MRTNCLRVIKNLSSLTVIPFLTLEVKKVCWYAGLWQATGPTLPCTCSNCSVQLTTKREECQCCKEIDRCGKVMESFGDSKQCITLHPGFQDVRPALGLKTKSGKTYRMLFDQGQRSEAEFF